MRPNLFLGIGACLLLCYQPLLSQNQWRVKNRLQATYEFDDNIRESPFDSLETLKDSSVRVLFQSSANRNSATTQIGFNYKGGLQTYWRHSFENKLINEIDGTLTQKLGKISLGIQGSGRLKLYLNDIIDYSHGAVSVFVFLPRISGFSNKINLSYEGINYQNFTDFDYTATTAGLTVSRALAKRLSWHISLTALRLNFERPVIRCDMSGVSILEKTQEDHALRLDTQLNYTKTMLFNIRYLLQYNDSNSCGYSYLKHQFTLIVGLPLTEKIWLRGYASGQIKSYTDDQVPFFPTDLDTEREQSNFFIIDLSRDMSEGVTAILRLAYYNNESVIRSRFYGKTLLTAGFDFRF